MDGVALVGEHGIYHSNLKSCLWISTLSTVAPIPRLFFMTLSSARAAFVDTVFAMGGWPVAAQPAFAAAWIWP